MARSKNRRRRKSSGGRNLTHGGHYPKSRRRRDYAIAAAISTAIIAGTGTYWWWLADAENKFLALAAEGEAILAEVIREPSLGRTHLGSGESYAYDSRFPVSGPHYLVAAEPGFYTFRQAPIQLVHALEHGHIVIYYDKPGDDVLKTLQEWVDRYSGHWDGVVVTPMPRLGDRIELTAWTRRLGLARFDPAAAAFVDAFRGREPENPVR